MKTPGKLTALLMIAAISMGLAACKQQTEEKPNSVASVEPPQGIAPEVAPYPRYLNVGEEVTIDLDGDGQQETVLTEIINDADGWPQYAVSVNGVEMTKELGLYFDNPDMEHYAIVDLDTSDPCVEIALPDDGPSSDPNTKFVRYENGEMIFLGQVYGKVTEDALTFNSDGTISSAMRLSVLQTWFAPATWAISDKGVFEPVHQMIYYPIQSEDTPMKTATDELAAYGDMIETSKRGSIPVGTELKLLATDNIAWVQCEDIAGNQFWIHLDETGQMVELADGTFSWNAIAGLSLAD